MAYCNPCSGNYSGNLVPPIVLGDAKDLVFINTENIRFEDTINSSGKREIRAYYIEYEAPIVTFVVTPTLVEVGSTNDFTFTINTTEQSSPIISRILTPDEGLTGLTGPFVFTKTDISSNTPGIIQSHTLTVQDSTSNPPIVITVGVRNRFRVFQGFSPLPLLNEANIEAMTSTLGDSILSVYGGTRAYTLPFAFQYVYWIYEIGTQALGSVNEGPLPVPIYLNHPNIVVTNSFGVSASYRVIRTANGFGAGSANFTLL